MAGVGTRAGAAPCTAASIPPRQSWSSPFTTGFAALDVVPHVLTAAHVTEPATARVVLPRDVPNANWLRPGDPSADQQAFGDALLADHPFVLVPSVVSTHSWNVIFDPEVARGRYVRQVQEAFALDPRMHPSRTR